MAPPEYARRTVELIPELMLGFPQCSRGRLTAARCDGLGAGGGLGFSALWRASPYFALGGTLDLLAFRLRPPAGSGLDNAAAGGAFIGVLGRVYFTDRGAIDPYLQLGLGAGLTATSARESDGATYGENAAGAALQLGAGVDFYLSPGLRLGPALDFTRFAVGHVRRCKQGASCVDLQADDYAHGTGFISLGARLSVLLGQAL